MKSCEVQLIPLLSPSNVDDDTKTHLLVQDPALPPLLSERNNNKSKVASDHKQDTRNHQNPLLNNAPFSNEQTTCSSKEKSHYTCGTQKDPSNHLIQTHPLTHPSPRIHPLSLHWIPQLIPWHPPLPPSLSGRKVPNPSTHLDHRQDRYSHRSLYPLNALSSSERTTCSSKVLHLRHSKGSGLTTA